MGNDLRYALRGLARNPGFGLAAILTLALGIGAVTSVVSVGDAVCAAVPYPEQARLVMVWDQLKNLGVDRLGLYAEIFATTRRRRKSLKRPPRSSRGTEIWWATAIRNG